MSRTSLTKPGTKWYLVTADYALGHQLEADTKTLVTPRAAPIWARSGTPFPRGSLVALADRAGLGRRHHRACQRRGDTVDRHQDRPRLRADPGQAEARSLLSDRDGREGRRPGNSPGNHPNGGLLLEPGRSTRAFTDRFKAQNGTVPSAIHAGVYSSVGHYLKAVAAAKSDEAKTVIAKMRELPIEDEVVRNARLREDGRMVHDFYIFQVKKPVSQGRLGLLRPRGDDPGRRGVSPLEPKHLPGDQEMTLFLGSLWHGHGDVD